MMFQGLLVMALIGGAIVLLAVIATVIITRRFKSWPAIVVVWVLAAVPPLYVMYTVTETGRRNDRANALYLQNEFDGLCMRPPQVEILAKASGRESKIHFNDQRRQNNGFTPIGGIDAAEMLGGATLFECSPFRSVSFEITHGVGGKNTRYAVLHRDSAGIYKQEVRFKQSPGRYTLNVSTGGANSLQTLLVLREDEEDIARAQVFLYTRDREKRYSCPDYRFLIERMISGAFALPTDASSAPAKP